jgi:signal peptidase II
LLYGLAGLVVVLDQISKHWALTYLPPYGSKVWVPGLVRFQLTTNTGAAFSLFSGSTQALGLVSLAVAIGVVLWLERQGSLSLARQLGLALVLGGAIGNGLDRWRSGAVVDFVALDAEKEKVCGVCPSLRLSHCSLFLLRCVFVCTAVVGEHCAARRALAG